MDHPGSSLCERHQVHLVSPALHLPGKAPARRSGFVADAPRAAELVFVDRLHLLAHQTIERNEQLVKALAIILNPSLEVEVGFGDRHCAPSYPGWTGRPAVVCQQIFHSLWESRALTTI